MPPSTLELVRFCGILLLSGAAFAAADVCIDKLLEEARKNVLASSTDALRKEARTKLKGLKKAPL